MHRADVTYKKEDLCSIRTLKKTVIIMVKRYAECKVCKSSNFLNYAGLCKKCNREAAGSLIREALAEKQQKQIAAQEEREKQKIEDLKQEPASDETTDEEPDSKDDEKKENEDDPKERK